MENKQKKKFDYRKMFSIQSDLEKIVLMACPNMKHTSGIYFYTREDEDGKHAYIGKAVDLLRRSASHLQGYQHIDISLKKRGFYSKENENGWHLNFLTFPEHMLDKMERHYIDAYSNAGYHLYNIESGGTTGKTIINERKGPKTYTEGKKQGKKELAEKIYHLMDKYLSIYSKKDGKLGENALNKFWALISPEDKIIDE